MKNQPLKKYSLLVLCLCGAAFAGPAPASVLVPGEDPGQYSVQVYILNDSNLPYPPSGLVGDGFVRYESDWLDRQLAAWAAWADCDGQAHDPGECDELYAAIDLSGDSHIVSFDGDTISFDMLGLIVDAGFEMYGVTFGANDVTQWRETLAGGLSGFMSVGTIFEMVNGDDSIYLGAGDEEYTAEVRLNGHSGFHDLSGCYAQDPDGSSTEDLCYDISVVPVAASVAEPDAVVLLSLGVLALGIARRNKSRA